MSSIYIVEISISKKWYSQRFRGKKPAVKVELELYLLLHGTYFEIRVVFSKFKIEGRDRTSARAGPTAGLFPSKPLAAVNNQNNILSSHLFTISF